MNLDSLSFALSNISYSVANLTKKNFKSSVQEISRVSSLQHCSSKQHPIFRELAFLSETLLELPFRLNK